MAIGAAPRASRDGTAGKHDVRSAWWLGEAPAGAARGARAISSTTSADRPAAERRRSCWLICVALEPYVRRYGPEILMSWSRSARRPLPRSARRPRHPRQASAAGACRSALVRCRAGAPTAADLPARFAPPPQAPSTNSLGFLLADPARAVGAAADAAKRPGQRHADHAVAFALARMLVKRLAKLPPRFQESSSLVSIVTEAGTEQLGLNALFAGWSLWSMCWSSCNGSACSPR